MLLTAVHQAISMNDFPLAEEYAIQLKEKQKGNAAAYLLLGTIYTRKREYVKAIDALQQANRLNPDNPDTLNNLAIVYKRSGDLTGALETIKQAFKIAPEKADICYNIANLYKESGNHTKAESFYKKAINGKPPLPLAYNNLGTMYEADGSLDKAISIYKEGLSVDPNHPTLHYNLGIVLTKKGRMEEALAEFRKAVRSKPGWVDGLNNLGAVLLELGKEEDALHTFKNAYNADPDNIQALNNMGLTLTRLNRFEEAKGYLQKAIKLKPDYTNAAMNLGRLQEKSGSETSAIDVLKSIINKGSATTEIRLLLGKLLLQQERFTEASDTIRSALRRDSKNSEGHTLLGILNVKTGKKKRAFARFNKALELSPSNLEARYQRALLLHETGKLEKSLPDLEYIFAREPSFYQTKLLLAEAYLQTGVYDKALSLYQDLKQEYPDDERIIHQLVYLYKQADDKESALNEAEELIVLQGKNEEPDSADKMESSLMLYEGIINDFEKEYEKLLNRNIEIFLNETGGLSVSRDQHEAESLLAEEIPDLEGEVVPIIDFGGIEPIIEVNEEDREVVNLLEMEEIIDLPDEEEDIETIRAALLQEKSGNGTASNVPAPQYQPQYYHMEQPVMQGEFTRPQIQPGTQQIPPVYQIPVPQIIIAQSTPVKGEPGTPPQIIVHYNQKPPETKNQPEKRQERDRRKKDEFEEHSENPADLLGYLEDLTRYLPEKKRKNFEESEMKLKIETLKAKMSGKPGLVQIIKEKYRKSDTLEEKEGISKDKIESTFKFMNNLTEYLPDKTVGMTIKNKIDHILIMMKDVHGKGKTT